MNFIVMLKNDHKEAKETFETLLEQDSLDKPEAEKLCKKLLLHMEMEEKDFYPLMEKYKQTGELAQEAELEHKEAKKIIEQLLNSRLEELEFKVKLELLQAAIEHHIEEEESELLPKAEDKLSKTQIEEITEKMKALKEQKEKSIIQK